jgi:hypothetical protein
VTALASGRLVSTSTVTAASGSGRASPGARTQATNWAPSLAALGAPPVSSSTHAAVSISGGRAASSSTMAVVVLPPGAVDVILGRRHGQGVGSGVGRARLLGAIGRSSIVSSSCAWVIRAAGQAWVANDGAMAGAVDAGGAGGGR